MQKVAIQGINGSFHSQAAKKIFSTLLPKGFDQVECNSFNKLAKLVFDEKVDYAVMAIENSIVGAILPNYNLLLKYGLIIIDEIYMPIEHYLMALPQQTICNLDKVYSHPMALAQCEDFFEKYPKIQLVENIDTAFSAKYISDNNLKNIGAIAPIGCAKIYNLQVIANKIQTVKNNFTRFFVIQKNIKKVDSFNKVSIQFKISHQKGELARILNILNSNGLNISKIQSVPIINEPWNYSFFMDLVLNGNSNFNLFLEQSKDYLESLYILGKYINKKPSLNS